MTEFDERFVILLIWGLGTVLAYALVLRGRVRSWRVRRDSRSRRELVSGLGLFMTALASCTSLTVVLFGEAGTSLRGWFIALALGAFTGSGIIMATEPEED
jgi:hypothetical protein